MQNLSFNYYQLTSRTLFFFVFFYFRLILRELSSENEFVNSIKLNWVPLDWSPYQKEVGHHRFYY